MILTSPRSGSTWLVDALNGHPRAVVFGEALQPGRGGPFRFGAANLLPYELHRRRGGQTLGPLPAVRYLRTLYAIPGEQTAVGFKLMYGHAARHPTAAAYLRLTGIRIIHLIRSNPVDAAISNRLSVARGRGGGHDTGTALPPVRLRVEPAAFVSEVATRDRTVRVARAVLAISGADRLEVTYEGMLDDPAGCHQTVLRFLGLPPSPEPLPGTTRRLSSGDQGAQIENFDEVRDALARAGFGRHLR